jgi:hypothetical protein
VHPVVHAFQRPPVAIQRDAVEALLHQQSHQRLAKGAGGTGDQRDLT